MLESCLKQRLGVIHVEMKGRGEGESGLNVVNLRLCCGWGGGTAVASILSQSINWPLASRILWC